ncbi:putative transcriptional regulator [Dyadobacter jejuensis]|uniref:UPF0301 protein CLV98_101151 n=1 Tax=Dyadobacter jejuensis TaxID=1082580 RepID=A0A316ARJ0_9BACT|nr:YqgE/AlgH family protein [Dyadobacter jejuensis]PWJ59976.1 putative transcriptional regulator [Dyadobacter jejuensis]
MQQINKGSILIAQPYLGDPNFERGAVLICEYAVEGCFGFVLNQPTNLLLSDVLEESIYQEVPLYLGGPVEKNTLHYIHRRPDLIDEGVEIMDGLYWGGDFDRVKTLININTLTPEDIRFFIGYSGWGTGQIEDEMEAQTWIVTKVTADFLFNTPADQFWRAVLREMGGEYRSMSHYPIDPRLN